MITVLVLVLDADPAVRLAAKRVQGPAGLTLIAVSDFSAAVARLAVVRADLVMCDVDALAPDGTPAIEAIADIGASAQMLALFPKQRDTRAIAGYGLGK